MNRYALVFVLLTSLMDSIGFGIIMPVLPGLLMEITGEPLSANVQYGGWLMFVFAIMQFFFSPLVGNLSDRFGRRPILLVSLFIAGINYLIMGFAETLLLLFVGRIISGLGASSMSTCNAYIADITPAEDRATRFGLIGAAFGMGFVIGPVIGGYLGEFGTRMPFFAAAAISFANMAFGLFVLKESLPPENRRSLDLTRANPVGALIQIRAFPMVFGIVTVMFISSLAHHVLPATWSFWGIEKFNWSPKEIGYSLGFVGIGMVLVQGVLIRWVIPKTGPRVAAILGFSFSVIAFMGYAFAGQVRVVYVALIFGALGGFANPAMQGIASGQISADRQGQLQGGISSMISLTAIISPLIMTQTFGFFTDKSGFYFPGAAFFLAAVLTLCALALFMHYTKSLKNPATTSV